MDNNLNFGIQEDIEQQQQNNNEKEQGDNNKIMFGILEGSMIKTLGAHEDLSPWKFDAGI